MAYFFDFRSGPEILWVLLICKILVLSITGLLPPLRRFLSIDCSSFSRFNFFSWPKVYLWLVRDEFFTVWGCCCFSDLLGSNNCLSILAVSFAGEIFLEVSAPLGMCEILCLTWNSALKLRDSTSLLISTSFSLILFSFSKVGILRSLAPFLRSCLASIFWNGICPCTASSLFRSPKDWYKFESSSLDSSSGLNSS